MITKIPESAIKRMASYMWIAGDPKGIAIHKAQVELSDAVNIVNKSGGKITWWEE